MEGISVEDEALLYLGDLASKATLRYSVQLLNPSNQLAKVYANSLVDVKVIKEASELFFDAKQSAKIVSDNSGKFMK